MTAGDRHRLPAILLLAAGASTRMGGRDKLLEPVPGGEALLVDRARVALATGAPVLVALPPRDAAPARWACLEGLPLIRVVVERPERGLSASLGTAVAALPQEAAGALVMLADMPEITVGDLAALMAEWDGATIRRAATADGTPGNPVLFPAAELSRLAGLTGDRGARDLLQAEAEKVRLVTLPGRHALTDLDTPDDWLSWRGTWPG